MEEALSNTIIRKVTHLCDKGDAFFDELNLAEAIETYKKALDLLPEPFIEWEISTYLTVSIADAFFYLEDFAEVASFMEIALLTPEGLENPLVHLRLGQACLELQEPDRARKYLQRAFDMEGAEIFQDDDAKYLAFISSLS
jgi:tetratricopeptide (TPR) repeat protein